MENVENINEDQPKSSHKKKKTLLLILLLLLIVLIGIAIALPLLLIKDEVKISDLKLEQNVFKYNENYLNAKVYVFYDDDSEKEITLNDTYISQEDKEKFNIVGENHQITLTYENFSKAFYITIVEAEFSPSEIDNLVYSDQIVEFNTKGWFFPVTNLPEGASVSYNIEGIIENQASYSLIEPGTYIIEAIISKPNYKSLNINFTIRIADTSISIENFEKIEDMYFTNVSADTTYIDFTKIVKINDKEGIFEIFADENLSTKLDKTNITINAGENHYYLKVFFEDNSITKVFDIVIYKNGMFNIKFILNSETLDEYQIEEDKVIEKPDYTKEGYLITGWEVNGELVTFPYQISSNTTFNAVYQLINYNIQQSITGEGSINLSKETANVGDEILITINPGLGFETSKIYYKAEGQDEEIEIKDNKFNMPAKNVIIYVEFVKSIYNISKNQVLNGDFTVSKNSASFGENISISFLPNPGYELEEVYYLIEGSEEKNIVENSKFIMPIGNITIYVNYTPIIYTINLILNDGMIEGEENINYTVESETFTLNKPTKEGYSFLGWSSDEIEVPQEKIVIEKGTIGNKEYIANWTINTYSITKGEILNGNLEIVPSAQFNSLVTISIIPNEGYELDKIYYKENNEGNEIIINENSFNMPANDVTVYATFRAINYDILKAEIENGTFNISQSSGIIGDEILVTPIPNQGYELDKIYYLVNNEGEEILIQDNRFNMPANDVTIYVVFEKIDYTISKSEEVNGTINISKNIANINDLITVTTQPNVGYTLVRIYYKLQDSDDEIIISDGSFIMPASNITIFAEFKKVDYTIAKSEMTNGDIEISLLGANLGEEINITPKPNLGYELDRLYYILQDDSEEIEIIDNTFIMPAGNLTVYATFKTINYTITLDPAEGTLVGSRTINYTVESEDIILEEPTREGYDFVGWSGTGLDGIVKNVTIQTGSTGDREYLANWEIKKFTIIWQNEDGEELKRDENVEYGTLPTYDGTPTKQSTAQYDYKFAGWEPEVVVATENATYKATYTPILRSYTIIFNNKNVTVMVDEQEINSGDKVEYGKTLNISYQETEGYHKTSFKVNDEEQESPYSVVVNEDVTISYSEEINVYTVTLPSGEGYTIESSGNQVNHGQSFKFKLNLIEGYTQSNVVVKSNNNEISIEEGYYTILNITGNQTVTVEGVVLNTYTITWNNYDGTPLLQTEVTHGQKPTYTGETPTKDKTQEFTYTFSDWNPKIVVATEDTTYTAQFIETKNRYTVTFNSNEGSEVENITKEYGSEIGKLPIPTFEGYDFVGWFTQLSGGEQINEMTLITTNITLYAHWVATSYNIDLNLDGGQISEEYKNTYTIEDENFVLPTPTKEGYNFLGWSKDGVGQPEVLVTVLKGTTGDLNYTAKWQINQYTYTFYRYEGGDILKQETVDYGTNIVAPTNVIRASDNVLGKNYNFTGWNQEVPSTIGASNIEFYALYDEENFSAGLNFVYSSLDGYYIVDKGSTTETSIIVPSTYTTLENGKANVSEVAENGFSNMNYVTIITFNGEIEYIGAAAFANDALLTKIIGLDQIYSIPESAFEGCSSLSSFNIGEKVIIIGTNAFANTGLTSVYIPSSVVSIENRAFENCYIENYSVSEDNLNYASYEGDLYNKNLTKLLLYANGKTANTFSVPSFVNEIENYAFGTQNNMYARSLTKSNTNIQNIIIPDNVIILNDYSLNSALIVYTEFSNKPNGWSELSISQNEIYWNSEWVLQDNQPTIIIEASAFKTGVYQNWMSYISDETLFVDVVMPGSHDAGTMSISATNLHTQSSGFYDQLTGGVRYFDMRVAEYDGTVRCIHANSNDNINDTNGTGVEFAKVLSDIQRFLNDNPYEILILDFQHIWNDFESKVVPMIEESLSGMMLTKDKAANYLSLTMGQLRQWGVNIILVAQDDSKELRGATMPNFDQHNYMYKRTENLRSEYDGDTHRSSASDLIGIWPTYFNNFTEDQYNKIFILQTQLTSGDLVSREKSIRNDANKFFRNLKKDPTNLAKVNVIMRDFVVDDLSGVDSAQSSIQSIIFLNVYKNQIKETELERFKLLIDFDTVDSWVTA